MILSAIRLTFVSFGLFLVLLTTAAMLLWSGVTTAWAQQANQPAQRAARSQIEEMMPPIGPGEITVGLMGPITDKTEGNIKTYLESGGLDHVIQVKKVWDVLPKLAEVSSKAGKKIKYLILAGHGSDDPNMPGFGIGGTAFGPSQINFAGFEWEILKARTTRNEKIRELCEFQKSRDPIERKLSGLVGDPSSAGKEYRLMTEIETIDRQNKDRMKFIVPIHDAQGIMAEDGVIVLFNCFSGLSEHLNFAMDLGVLFFGGKRGKMYIHERPISIGKVPDQNGAWKALVQLIGYFTEGHLKTGGKAILWANFDILPVPEMKPQLIPATLHVAVIPAYSSVKEGAEARLKSDVATLDDSATIVYEWEGCAEKNAADCLVETAGKKDALLQGKVVVKDKLDRTGEGPFCVVVESENVEIQLSPDTPEEDSVASATARVKSGREPEDSLWYWTASGGVTVLEQKGQNAKIEVKGEGKLFVRLFWIGPFGKDHDLAVGSIVVKPKKKEDKKDGVVIPPVAPGTDKADPGKTDSKWVPTCSYTYSEWGECSRATKKQTRTLTGKEPQGCVEKGKPALEQGCTPPPTEEEKKAKLLSCLCRCYSGASMETYVGYKPSLDPGQDPKSGLSCDSLANGPCISAGWGCWRSFLGAPNDCAKGCYEGIYGKGTYNEKDADKLRKDENKKFKKPLAVKIKPSKNPADFGDIVELSAEVTGGTGGPAYSWGGCAQDAKDARAKVVNTRTCTSCQASVSVTDQDGDSATDTITIQCAALKVKLTKETPQANTLPVGSQATFFAEVFSGDKPAGGTFFYMWERNPDVLFGDAKNPKYETQGGSQSRNTATFQKTGTTPVWVSVLKEIEGRKATVGESAQIQIEVVNPQLDLTFVPKEPYVGQEIKAKLTVKPEIKEIDFRWMPVPGNAKQSMESKDGKEITFTLKDDKPAEIQVKARVPVSGEDLGEAKNTIKAKKYTVNVTGPKAMGPKPRVWKEGVGLVDVEKEIAVDQVVEFAADTQPAALTGPVKYQWTVTGGSCTVSNPISREARATASAAGDCELSVVIKDKNDVQLGEGKGSFNATITRETIAAGQKKAKDVNDSKTKVADAKTKARKGDYDGAIKDAEEAGKLDPANKDAAGMADKLRKEKETIHQQIDKAKKLMDENKFADAQKELIVASNLNGYYPPVPAANQELGTRWNKYNSEVRDKVYEVRSANEKKDFGKALEIAAAWRASTKLDPYAEKELKQQEDWAKQWKAQKDRQIETLKAAGEKAKNYDYAGALKQYDEGFANGQNIYNGSEPEYKEAVELRSQAFTKNKRLNELIPWVRKAAEDKEYMTVDALQNTLKTADEAIALQPNNEQLKKWREQIVARAEKTKADNDRTAAGRKYLDTARSEENTYLSQVSYVQSKSGQWGENVEVDMQSHIQKAIDNYRESLKYIPDAAVEKKIKELEATLEGRKKYLENYRLSVTLKNDADALYRQATQDPDIQSASPKYDEAAEKYRKSLSLYRPFNAETIEKTIYVLETYKHERWVKKYWADGQALEKEGKIVEAVAAYDKALAAYHPTVPQSDRMWIQVHAQELRNKINGAKNWRADGEAKQKAGKIAEAIASYKQSLALLPDAALAEHVRMLEGRQAEAGEKKASADRLWQEGTTLFNQGRPSDALSKFKESLGYWSDASRQKYVADMEARRARAVALRDEGAKLQQGNRIPEAIAKYKESLTYWPDTGLSSHIATLEGKLKQDNDTATRKARAKQLRDEGYALQQKNQLQAAVGKYKESLAILPDKQLEDYIRQLEAKIAAVPTVVTPPLPVTPQATASFDGTYGGTVSGASTGTLQLTVSGASVTGTVNGKYGQDAYRATLSGTIDRSTGEFSTKLAGEVTGTPFQGGLKGRIQGSSASGDWHARNQYGNPTGSWQASRGAIPAAQTTAAQVATATASINIVGRWKTEALESGKVIDVNYTTFNRDGSYVMDVSPESLGGTAVCTVRGSYTLSGQTLNLRPQGSQCKFNDGTTRSEPADKYETVSGKISGSDRAFTYEPPGTGVTVRYTRQ